MKSHVTSIVLAISIFIVVMSSWGLGKADANQDDLGRKSAGIGLGIGLLAFVAGVILAIKMPEIENYCAR